MKVYHDGTCEIKHPDIVHSKDALDFGRGFYVTYYRKQAERWARRKALRNQATAFLNIYDLEDDLSSFRVLKFPKIEANWLDFICACRRGAKIYQDYDIIIGPVADDDVFQAVNFYFRGIWTQEQTLKELAFAMPNDQIAILSQTVLDLSLSFIQSVPMEDNHEQA